MLKKRLVLLLMLLMSMQSLAAIQMPQTVTTPKTPIPMHHAQHQMPMTTDDGSSSCLEHCQQQALTAQADAHPQADHCQPGHCQLHSCISNAAGAGIHQSGLKFARQPERHYIYPPSHGLSGQITPPLLRPPIPRG
ncbi:hypothetical protein [Neptuniibacter sp. CAU 1671]|uniref:hypothetical protein n=1 Tax=Neptuniibacter sp. CAU 1671 TaxID=3032593 RepID=UPI0023DC6ED8|nr:hypothetical protein [Neptuniibacter sp. CAU 1671]MDF2181608.1 hypothetical protein [Neptuniibacter sp. CAU 1671]